MCVSPERARPRRPGCWRGYAADSRLSRGRPGGTVQRPTPTSRRPAMSLSRRTFLGASVAGLAAAPVMARPAGSKVVVGVMGTGGRGTGLAQTFAGQPNVEVAYVCDVDEARAGKAAD